MSKKTSEMRSFLTGKERDVKKKIFTVILSLALLVTMIPMCSITAQAEATVPEITNVKLDYTTGDLSWDPFDGAEYYSIAANAAGDSGIHNVDKKTSVNLNELLESRSAISGKYTIWVEAMLFPTRTGYPGKELAKTKLEKQYNFTTKLSKLAAPTNLRFDGKIIRWDPVPNANQYVVTLYNGSDTSKKDEAKDKSSVYNKAYYDYSKKISAGNTYFFTVQAKAQGKYANSDTVTSSPALIKQPEKKPITNMKISNDGILSWDPVETAVEYQLGMNEAYSNIGPDTYVNLNKYLALKNSTTGTYKIKVNGISSSNDQIAYGYLTYDYVAPVAHKIDAESCSVTVYGKEVTEAIEGDTVTLTSDDKSLEGKYISGWASTNPYVKFSSASGKTTTFTMPGSDVYVKPVYSLIEFTTQPRSISYAELGGTITNSFVVSDNLDYYQLVDASNNQVIYGSGQVKAGEKVLVKIPPQNTEVVKSYKIVGQAGTAKVSSNVFTAKWIDFGDAPKITFNPETDITFYESIEVSINGENDAYDRIYYTLNGQDPKDVAKSGGFNTSKNKNLKVESPVKIDETTTIKARACNTEGTTDEAMWGPLTEATFTKVSTLPVPTISQTDTKFTKPLKVSLAATGMPSNAYLEYDRGDGWKKYDPAAGIEIFGDGTTELRARTSVAMDRGTYVEVISSSEATATYTKIYNASIDNVSVAGTAGKAMTETDVKISLHGDIFKGITVGADVSSWFNLPKGLSAKIKSAGYYDFVATISGTPTDSYYGALNITIPAANLRVNNTAGDLKVLANSSAAYQIAPVEGGEAGIIVEVVEDQAGKTDGGSAVTTMTASKAKSLAGKLTLVAKTGKTSKKNVKVTLGLDKNDKKIISQLKKAGYTFKYRYYRSTKKAKSYKSTSIKKSSSYTYTSGKKNNKYYYKVQVRVYKGSKLIAYTKLNQCKYASRKWTK